MKRMGIGALRSLAGAAIGGAMGYGLYLWLLRQGLYALVLPGAGVGLGCHLASLDRSKTRGVLMAVVAIALGLVADWRTMMKVAPFVDFLQGLPHRVPWVWVMLGLGGVLGYWWGREASPWIGRKPVRTMTG